MEPATERALSKCKGLFDVTDFVTGVTPMTMVPPWLGTVPGSHTPAKPISQGTLALKPAPPSPLLPHH